MGLGLSICILELINKHFQVQQFVTIKSMKVGMDISQTAHGGGVATYTENLASHLLSQPELEMVFFYSSLRKRYPGNLPKSKLKSFNLPPSLFEVLFNKIRNFPIEKFVGEVDIFHSSDWVQPPSKARKVTTYHDVIPLKYPEWSTPKIVSVHKRRLQLVEKEIDMVIAVSETTKKDLLSLSSIPENKITVIYEAASDDFKIMGESKVVEFKKKYKLPDQFILAIGGIGIRRNLARVKEAADKIPVIITGQDLPFLKMDEMVLLYNAASVLVYPSLYEGFGLPILEAMQSGTSVVTSNLSSMAEIGKDAAVLVDPTKTDSIREGIKQALADQKQLQKKGLERAKQFSWQKAAQQTAKLYEQVYES